VVPYTNFNSGGIQPSDNINITGVWNSPIPTGKDQIANKDYVDSVVNDGASVDNVSIYLNGNSDLAVKPGAITDTLMNPSGSVIYNWDTNITYAVGQVVIYSGIIWICRVAGSGLQPNVVTVNWKQLCNVDVGNYRNYVQPVTANYNWVRGFPAIRVTTSSATPILVTLATLASFADSDSSNRIQQFLLLKEGSLGSVNLKLSGSDVFTDGANSLNVVGSGITIRFYADFGINKWRIV
jgi:hypothetical protein